MMGERMMGEPHFEFSDEFLKRAARAVDTGMQLYESYSNTNELLNDFVSVFDDSTHSSSTYGDSTRSSSTHGGSTRSMSREGMSRAMAPMSTGTMMTSNAMSLSPLTTVEVNANRRDITLAITENPVMIALGLVADALEYVRKLPDMQLLANVDLIFSEIGGKEGPVLLLKVRNDTSQRAIRLYSAKVKSSTRNTNDGMVVEFAGIQLRLNNDISLFVIAILAVIIIGCGYAYIASRRNGGKLLQ